LPRQIFADTFARPLTTKITCISQPSHLLTAAVIRLAIGVPVFFLYIAGGSAEGGGGAIPSNDTAFCFGVAVYSFFSGYLVTLASQAAPETVPSRYRSQVANLCSISFQSAFAAALLLALVLRALLFPDP
jgi:hypothetical protein